MQSQPQFIINAAGERVSVILSIEDYEELLEDLEDLAAIADQKGEPTIPHEEVIAELKANGLL
ncbi:hypothetical protein D5085_02720 [Ectothiorhodospiraceae bacterium BW-2]|nr:hypothetical protein D5085_02720 [Ectothiorhodospiraceae bacterium BW-2]